MVVAPLLFAFLQPADLELSIPQDASERLDFPLLILQLPLQPVVRLLQGLAVGLKTRQSCKTQHVIAWKKKLHSRIKK